METQNTSKRSPRKGTQTKDRLVDIAFDLFQRRGYAAVGLNELCDEGGVPKGSVYYHFPNGKTDIALAVIEKAGAEVAGQIELAGPAVADAHQFVELLVDGFAQTLATSKFEKGCPISTLALELGAEEADIAAAIAESFAQWQDAAARWLHKFGVPDAQNRAQFMLCAVQGALILARAQKSISPLDQSKTYLISMLR